MSCVNARTSERERERERKREKEGQGKRKIEKEIYIEKACMSEWQLCEPKYNSNYSRSNNIIVVKTRYYFFEIGVKCSDDSLLIPK